MRTTAISLLLLFVAIGAQATDVIVRQSGGQSHFHYDQFLTRDHTILSAVFDDALNGDTIYLPGVTYTLGLPVTINKQLTIIGTGVHPDSIEVVDRTKIVAGWEYLNLATGSSGSEIHGITFDQVYLRIGNSGSTQDVHGLLISRCHLAYVYLAYQYNATPHPSNISIRQCYIEYLDVRNAEGVHLYNNIIETMRYGVASTTASNNLFLDFNQASGLWNVDVSYQDNIFIRDYTSAYTVNDYGRFRNNLWIMPSGGTVSYGSNITVEQDNLLTNASLTNIFVDLDPADGYDTFDYHYNYRLNPNGSQYSTYSTMGLTGGEVGIYGGLYPWKDGSVPFNPHWLQLSVPAQSNGSVLTGTVVGGSAQTN